MTSSKGLGHHSSPVSLPVLRSIGFYWCGGFPGPLSWTHHRCHLDASGHCPSEKGMRMQNKVIIVHLANQVTQKSADEPYVSYGDLKDAIQSIENLQSHYDCIHIDTSSLRYINSTGLGLLVKIADVALDKAARIVLYAPCRPIQTLFEMLKLTELFEIIPETEGYLKKLQNKVSWEIFVTIEYDPYYV